MAAAEKTMSAAGVKTALERSRQLSASLPSSSRVAVALGFVEVEEGF